MHTSLRTENANCSSCFTETLDALAELDGVRSVTGSIAGPCIEIEHDDGVLDAIVATIRDHLHGVALFANEVQMAPIETVPLTTPCIHHGAATETGPRRSSPIAIDPATTLAEIVTRHPSLAAELERRGLDYCCHGMRTLEDAAVEAGMDPHTVVADLTAVTADEPPAEWSSLGPADLVDHIETVHHAYLRSELPRISALVDKIVAVHGDRHPELGEVRRVYSALRDDLEPHLWREEQLVFPLIRELHRSTARSADTGPLAERIDSLMSEHETVGELLDELRRVTSGYAVPADGCATYAACYRALAELEADTHLHVHKENNIVFPAVRGGHSDE